MSAQTGIANKLKYLLNKDERLTKHLKVLTEKSSNIKEQTSKHVVTSSHIIGKGLLSFVKALPFAVLIVAILGLQSALIVYPYNFLLNTLSNISLFTPSMVGFTSIVIVIILFLALLVFLLPLENKAETNKKLLTWGIVIVLIPNLFFYVRDTSTYEPSELAQIGVNRTSTGIGDIFEKISCSWSYECTQKELQKDDATTTQRSEFSIRFESPQLGVFTPRDLEQSLPFTYRIQSSDPIRIVQFSCRERSNSTPFYSENVSIDVSGEEEIPIRLECENLQSLPIKSEETQHTIVVETIIETQTLFSQEIPILNYNYVLREAGLNEFEQYSYTQLYPVMSQLTNRDTEFSKSNDAIDVTISGLKDQLPLLFEDTQTRQISFPLTISGENSPLGNLKSWSLTEFELPSSLSFDQNTNIEEDILVQGDSNRATKRFYLIESESFEVDEKRIQTLNMVIESTFVKEERFNIDIIDENFNRNSSLEE